MVRMVLKLYKAALRGRRRVKRLLAELDAEASTDEAMEVPTPVPAKPLAREDIGPLVTVEQAETELAALKPRRHGISVQECMDKMDLQDAVLGAISEYDTGKHNGRLDND